MTHTPQLLSLTVSDSASVWAELGFAVRDGCTRIGNTTIRFDGNGNGITGWALEGTPAGTDIAGILTDPVGPAAPVLVHPNGVYAIDHLVLMTPNVDRTVSELAIHSMECRRRRVGRSYGKPIQQAFFWLGQGGDHGTILEVVGPPEPDPIGGSASFFGICLTVSSLDETAKVLGALLKPPVDAVQAGRQIATVSSRSGSAVAIALMSPHLRSEP